MGPAGAGSLTGRTVRRFLGPSAFFVDAKRGKTRFRMAALQRIAA
jgi:hypothetical protein